MREEVGEGENKELYTKILSVIVFYFLYHQCQAQPANITTELNHLIGIAQSQIKSHSSSLTVQPVYSAVSISIIY